MFNFQGDKKGETVLLVDIGNGSIGAALLTLDANRIPNITHNVRLAFPVVEKLDALQLVSGMSTLLDEILADMIQASNGKAITSVLVTLSSPWFISKTKHIHVEDEKSFSITKSFLEEMIGKEEEIFQKELIQQTPIEETGDSESFKIIEKNIVHVKINGYSIQDTIGKKAKSFEAFLCLSVVGTSIVEKIYDLILRHTHVSKEKVIMHTFPLVSFSIIRDIYPDQPDFILMDITGEITDITLVEANVIIGTASFPSGRNFIIRQVAKAWDISPEIALSTIHMCIEGKAEQSVVSRMQELLISVEKEWSIYMEDTLSSISKNMVLPSRVYITSDGDLVPIFIDFLKIQKSDTTYNFRKNIDIVHISHEILSKLYKADTTSRTDEFIAILAIFYSKLIKNS